MGPYLGAPSTSRLVLRGPGCPVSLPLISSLAPCCSLFFVRADSSPDLCLELHPRVSQGNNRGVPVTCQKQAWQETRCP